MTMTWYWSIITCLTPLKHHFMTVTDILKTLERIVKGNPVEKSVSNRPKVLPFNSDEHFWKLKSEGRKKDREVVLLVKI